MTRYVIPLDQLGLQDIDSVGGKNASLGEMITHLTTAGVRVPGGFATTADAYREFLNRDELATKIDQLLAELDVDNLQQLASTGQQIRDWILQADFARCTNRSCDIRLARALRRPT